MSVKLFMSFCFEIDLFLHSSAKNGIKNEVIFNEIMV